MYQNAIEHYLRDVPGEILKHYWAHGVNRGRELEWLTAALNILSNNGIKGDVGKMNSMYSGFMNQCGFLVILDKGEPFPDGKPQKLDETGLFKINVGALIVNTQFYSIVDRLRELFPNKKIIKANEIPEFFKE